MFPITNHHSDKTNLVKSFEDDKLLILNSNMGLRYWKGKDGYHVFGGNYYLIDDDDKLIKSFNVIIAADIKRYPYSFPLLMIVDDSIDRHIDNHISDNGFVCIEHAYIAKTIESNGIRIFDFINYYVKKYLMWVLVKKHSPEYKLQEWSHFGDGNIELYKQLLNLKEEKAIQLFLKNYCRAIKPRRNEPCYCNNGKKLKDCHIEEIMFLRNTDKDIIRNDIKLFET